TNPPISNMPCRYMTLSTTERKLAVIAAIAFRGEDFVGSNFLAVGVKIRKQMAEATASAKTTPIPIRQWYHSPIGAETTRPRSPPRTVPAMNVPADRPAAIGWTSSFRYAMASAGTPPRAMPSNTRNSRIQPKVGATVAPIPNKQAVIMEIVMADLRPSLSSTNDHGMTAAARPIVEADTSIAA